MYDDCVNIEGKLVDQFFGEHLGKCKVFREERFWARVQDNRTGQVFEHSGKPDVVYRFSTRAMVIEYKTGFNEVAEAPTNPQLRDQVVLTKGFFAGVEEIAVAVIQPPITLDPTPAIYDVEAVKRAEIEMFERVIVSNNPQSARHAGEVQCQFCAAKMMCHEYNRWAGAMVIGMNNLLEVPVANWSAEQRSAYCRNRGIAKKWLAQVDEQVKGMLEVDPKSVPGYGLKPGAHRHAINNPQAAFERFTKLGGTPEQFMTAVAIGKSRLKNAVAEVIGAKGKTLDQAVALITKDIVTSTQAAPSIVSLDGVDDAEGEE